MFRADQNRTLNVRLAAERALFVAAIALLALYTLWPWLPGNRRSAPRTLVVYGFSILSEAINQGIFPAFADEWKARTGETVELVSSFAGSGTITNQILLGVPAQVALLSLELDGWRLVDGGALSGPTWQTLPHGGVINRTPFVILVRPGNPHGITSFADLAAFDGAIVHPDPLTSGGAQWAILAEYGSALRQTGDEAAAYAQLAGVWQRVVSQASSARAARTQFEAGFGDALITYEQELVYDEMRGEPSGDRISPPSTILSEHIAVVIDKNVSEDDRALVDAFVSFLWTERAQQIFVDYGFRSVEGALNAGSDYFPAIDDPFTVADLGGWRHVKPALIDAIWKDRVLVELGR